MKTNLMFAMMLMVSVVAFAQHRKVNPKERAVKAADRMKKELSLNDDQYGKVKSLNEKYADRYVAVRKDTSLTRGRTMSMMKKIRGEQETELKSILTSDQWNKWNEFKTKRKEDFKKHHDNRRGKPGHDHNNG